MGGIIINMVKNVCNLIRLNQWIKSVFVYAPLFFNGNFYNVDLLLRVTAVWFCFSLMSSSIYCLNDLCDIEADRLHPEKCNRPVASGVISKGVAWLVFIGCWVASVVITYIGLNNLEILCILLIYMVFNVLYCIKLKHVAILDVVTVSFGFVLRVVAGGLVVDIALSHWILLITFLLALLLSFSKRGEDIAFYEEGYETRKVVKNYSKEYINNVIAVLSAVIIVAYIMYTVSDEVIVRFDSEYVYVTAIFVIIGLLRYLQLTIVKQNVGCPTRVLLKDNFIGLCVLEWILCFCWIIYW